MDATAREISFCGHTVAILEEMVVPDTHLDPRFVTNPFVTDAPFIRSYAGVPLIVDPDLPVGTLCVLDTKPRDFAGSDLRALQVLANQVTSQLRADRMMWATKDTLTGVSSRDAAVKWLAHQSTANTRAAIYLDLDGFKEINDRYTHEAGDRVLATVAERLVAAVGDGHMVARLGGDEFVVLLQDVSEADLARTVARVRQNVDQPITCRHSEIPCTASFGAPRSRCPGRPVTT